MLKFFAIVISLLSCCLIFVGSRNPNDDSSCISLHYNDDYCDCNSGEDENFTSACSHLGTRFHCKGRGALDNIISSSRVHDGVCDCCDGSDEIGSPFHVICNDTCHEQTVLLKKQALQLYNKIKSGLQLKNELIRNFNRKKTIVNIDQRSRQQEYDEIKSLILAIRFNLIKEENQERSLRGTLLRERTRSCAAGNIEICDIFMKNKKIQEPLNEIKEEIPNYSTNKLSSVEKIMSATCPITNHLVDLHSYERKTIRDYLKYHRPSSAKKKIGAVETNPVVLQKQTLFSPYLDHGYEGRVLASQVLLEAFGVLIFPITLTLSGVLYLVEGLSTRVWNTIEYCATVTVTASGVDVDPGLRPPQLQPPEDEFHSNRTTCTTITTYLSRLLYQFDNESSVAYTVISYLHYNKYSLLRSFMKVMNPYWYPTRWALTLMIHSPTIFFQRYFTTAMNNLPPKREACLLRHGLQIAMKELNQIEKEIEIAQQEEIAAIKAANENNYNNNNNNYNNRKKLSSSKISSEKGSGIIRKNNKNEGITTSTSAIDYGFDHSWEILKEKCVRKMVAEYTYQLCFFQHIKQNNILLGKYQDWNSDKVNITFIGQSFPCVQSNDNQHKLLCELLVLSHSHSHSLESTSTNNRLINPSLPTNSSTSTATPNLSTIPSPPSTIQYMSTTLWSLLGYDTMPPQSNNKREWENEALLSQTFSHGSRCMDGLARSSVVWFTCGTTTSLLDIIETSKCYYELLVESPLACSEKLEQQLIALLSSLNVFGFEKSEL